MPRPDRADVLRRLRVYPGELAHVSRIRGEFGPVFRRIGKRNYLRIDDNVRLVVRVARGDVEPVRTHEPRIDVPGARRLLEDRELHVPELQEIAFTLYVGRPRL